ncbi:MAG: VWA domain-containing protein [Gammaproteobacteria bacterium]|nr:VWA domain-containing protein [Gammaproteobacteria bacterium]
MNFYELHWREPLWLAALLLLLLLIFLQHRSKHKQNFRLSHFADRHLLPYFINPGKPFRYGLIYSAYSLLILALSGPFLVSDQQQQNQHKALDIVLIVDISPSMNATDITPNRLTRAKAEIKDLLQLRARDRVALITFSANAYLTLPLTHDKDVIQQFVQALSSDLVRRKGSNLSRAIELAQETLSASKSNSRAIILLSDGEHHTPRIQQQAKMLQQQNIPLFVMGIGTTSGAPVIDHTGNTLTHQGLPVISKLNSTALQSLAQITQGVYSTPTADNTGWGKINIELEQLSTLNSYETYTQATFKLPPWLLMTALILILLPALPRVRFISWTLFLILPVTTLSPSATASAWQEAQALAALKNNDLNVAENHYRNIGGFNGNLGRGSVAYKKQLWPQAAKNFNKAVQSAQTDQERAKAHYNLGNALTQMKKTKSAVMAYKQALRFQPNYPRATFNLNLVERIQHLPATQDKKQTDTHMQQQTPTRTEQNETGHRPSKNEDNKTTAQIKQEKQSLQTGEFQGAYIPEKLEKLLQKRYLRRDQIDGLSKAETKPW